MPVRAPARDLASHDEAHPGGLTVPIAPDGSPLPYADQGASLDEILRSALDLFQEARQAADSDQDMLVIENITTQIQKLLAQNEKEEQDALGGKLSTRILKRAYGGAQ